MSATNRSRHHRRDGRGTPAHERLLAQEASVARLSPPDGYNARENARAAAMRHYVRSCQTCASPIYEDPGHCVQCAWDGPSVQPCSGGAA